LSDKPETITARFGSCLYCCGVNIN
jgi:hypothetical protein